MISFFRRKSVTRFFVSLFLLFFLRLAEFAIDYNIGDGNGSMTSPIGLLLNATYVILILFVSYYYSTVEVKFSNKYFVIGVIIIGFFLSYISLQKGHWWGDDFALYIAQAKAFTENSINELQANQKFTSENSAYVIGPSIYPWGYPVLISPVYNLFGLNLSALKIFTFVFLSFSLFLVYYLFRKEIGTQIFLFIAIFSLSPQFYLFKDSILSDIPFMFFALLGLAAIQTFYVKKHILYSPIVGYLLTGTALFLAYSVRTIGIALLPTLIACQIYDFSINYKFDLKKYVTTNWQSFLTYLVLFFGLFLYSLYFNYSDASYMSHLEFENFYEDIQFNIFYYINLISEFFEVPVLTNISATLWGVYVPFIVYGAYIKRNEDYALILFVIFMLSILIIAPYQGGLRYIFAYLPITFYFLVVGIKKIQNHFTNSSLLHFLLVPVLIIFSQSILIQTFNNFNNKEISIEGPFDKEGEELMNFINSNTLTKDVIIFYKPRALRLLTGRNGFVVKEVSQILDGRADILIIQKNAKNDWFPETDNIKSIKDKLTIIFENEDFFVYRILSN